MRKEQIKYALRGAPEVIRKLGDNIIGNVRVSTGEILEGFAAKVRGKHGCPTDHTAENTGMQSFSHSQNNAMGGGSDPDLSFQSNGGDVDETCDIQPPPPPPPIQVIDPVRPSTPKSHTSNPHIPQEHEVQKPKFARTSMESVSVTDSGYPQYGAGQQPQGFHIVDAGSQCIWDYGREYPLDAHELEGTPASVVGDVQNGTSTPSNDPAGYYLTDVSPDLWQRSTVKGQHLPERLPEQPSPVGDLQNRYNQDADTSSFYPQMPSVLECNKDIEDPLRYEDPLLNRRFLNGAWQMLKKLQFATKSETASPQLRAFVKSLGGLDSIINIGLKSLKDILDGDAPTDITRVYCFLHFAYAMSQAEKNANDETLPTSAFREGLEVFRMCLPSESKVEGKPTQQDLFDEIVNILWNEFQRAFKWVDGIFGKTAGDFNRHMKARISTRSMTIKGPPGGVQKRSPPAVRHKPALVMKKALPGATPNSLTILATPPQAVTKPLLSTMDRILNSTIFQETLAAVNKLGYARFFYLYLNTVSSEMLKWTVEYELRFPVTGDGSECVFCGDPHAWQAGCPTYDNALSKVTQKHADFLQGLYNQIASELENTEGNVCILVPGMPSPRAINAPNSIKPCKSTAAERFMREGSFSCPTSGCSGDPWVNEQSLDLHMQNVHSPEPRAFLVCGYNGCPAKRGVNGIKNKDLDNMRTHKREKGHFTQGERKRKVVGWVIGIKETFLPEGV
ncbi:hypothetical protein TWF730_005128 [Orbilia blumenaviensis]|uniref:C2H2-type domain-containing protein n=1 Tax=Orbilia blumenaviensis TaxID=1796055 RepID=A0AAV9VK82_9PEZI